MNNWIKGFIGILFSFITLNVSSQNHSDSIHFTGKVFDADSMFVIENAHIICNQFITVSDEVGAFYLWLRPGDTIQVRHVSYQDYYWVLNDSLQNPDMLLGIFLKRDTAHLAEVVIYPRIPELESLMTKHIKEDQDIRNAKSNLEIMAYQARYNPVKTWDAEMNTDYQLKSYQMQATYKGLLSPDEIVPVTAIIPLAFSLIQMKYNSDNKEEFRMTSYEEEVIRSLFQHKLNEQSKD